MMIELVAIDQALGPASVEGGLANQRLDLDQLLAARSADARRKAVDELDRRAGRAELASRRHPSNGAAVNRPRFTLWSLFGSDPVRGTFSVF
jgi:hypothetical protein